MVLGNSLLPIYSLLQLNSLPYFLFSRPLSGVSFGFSNAFEAKICYDNSKLVECRCRIRMI